MKKLVMTGPCKSEIIEAPIPEINDDQLLVQVIYTGMCHSEYYPWCTAEPGLVLGHESIGIVAKVGKNVQGFRVGERVTGLGGGGYQEYIVMEPRKVVHVPDHLKSEDAIVEPLACLLSTCERMMPRLPGDEIAVVGCGYMGLGMISLFKLCGYGKIVAVDLRREALDNALKFGATEAYTPDELPEAYRLNWETWGKPDLTRDGYQADIFHIGFQNVMEFTGTQSGLTLAGEMVCAHGRLGIGGFHNDCDRTLDFRLLNMKAIEMINCHERRIDYEATLCQRCIDLLASGFWPFTGVTRHIYKLSEFDRANREMGDHTNGFIKGAVSCEI